MVHPGVRKPTRGIEWPSISGILFGAKRALRAAGRIGLKDVESALMALTFALFVIYLGTVAGRALLRPRQVPVITVRVQPGDTLWTYANLYGSPDEYILSRVDHLAAYNHLSAGARLQAGQVLRIPVENPAKWEERTASAR